MIRMLSWQYQPLQYILTTVFLFLCSLAYSAQAANLREGRLSLLDPSARLSVMAAGLGPRNGAISFFDLTMEYRFGLLAQEPLMAFRGRYTLADVAVVNATDKCWEYLRNNEEDGLTAIEKPLVNIRRTKRFATAFEKSAFLSSSQFSLDIVPNEAIMIAGDRVQVAGMHVRFRPDSMVKAPQDYGLSVSGSPDWDALLQRADGSFYNEATAKRVFAVGFDVENLKLLEPEFNVNAISREMEALCREGLARLTAAAKPAENAPPPTNVTALENTLESAFGGDLGASPPTIPTPSAATSDEPKASGEERVANALALAAERQAQREKIDALRRSSQQFLGHVETDATSVMIYASDHGSEDGDRVTILLNGQAVETLTLAHAVQEIQMPLSIGDNVIEIKALNQGSSGENTALFWVKTEDGKEVAREEWELSTGGSATLLVVRI